jgi:hypothetical protein
MFSVSVSLPGTVIPRDEVPPDEANFAQVPILVIGLPFGSVIEVTDKVTPPVNVPIGFTAIIVEAPVGSPAESPRLFDSAATVKLPVCTTSCTEQEVWLPFASVPTIEMIDVPAGVPIGAVRLSVLLGLAAETDAGLRLAVEGVATSDAPAVKPLSGSSVIVLVTGVVPPIGTITESGLLTRPKLASTFTSIVAVAVNPF